MRLSRFALIAAAVVGVIGCTESGTDPVTAKIPPLAYVRYINAVPDTNNLTVRWIDQLDFSPMTFVNVPFRGMGQGGYQGLEAGSRTFRVFTYDPNLASSTAPTGATTQQIAQVTHNFTAGTYYTLLHVGYARTGSTPAQQVVILEDALPGVNTSVSLRAINAGLGLGALDFHATATATTTLVGSTPAITNVALNASSAYITRATGAFAIQGAATGTDVSLMGTLAPAGVSTGDPISGSTVPGSVMTAVAFPAAVAGSPAATASNTTPGVVFYLDRQPPRP